MAIDQLPSGTSRARLTMGGRTFTETFATIEQARDWETVMRAKAVTDSLPRRVTVGEYASRWLRSYDNAPANTRTFHDRNLPVVLATLGRMQLDRVVPTDITIFINRLAETKGVAHAERVASALFSRRTPTASARTAAGRQPADRVDRCPVA